MPNVVEVQYNQTGVSTHTNEMGMREMQARAYEARQSQYILLKAPPASGKSRALMFIALDKLYNQGIKKVIVAVPERQIAGSFAPQALSRYGFFADWEPRPKNDLCVDDSTEKSKVMAFRKFMESDDKILICTHATLRFAYQALEDVQFNDCLLAIDEFHHVSADTQNNQLGELLSAIMSKSTAHIAAMTGSYFRGDGVAVLLPSDEEKFTRVTYNYYDQLNGYTYLKTLGIGYHFYQGRYTSVVNEILDTDKKTILYIPNINSNESTKEKHVEVDAIIDKIGTIERVDSDTQVYYIKRASDGKIIKTANLVDDNHARREKIVQYLRGITKPDDLDLILALGMAKEGFDWPYCEHTLTVGRRDSLTEIVQIIGRCTRDCAGKSHAQFTNLVALPDATNDQLTVAVNNMLKAITCSLLMEQVLKVKFEFKARMPDDTDPNKAGEIKIRGFKEPSTARVKQIVESDLDDLKAKILQDPQMLHAIPGTTDPEVINKFIVPKIIHSIHPELTEQELEEVRQYVVADSAIKSAVFTPSEGGKEFITMAGRFVNIDELSIDLIDRINPFQSAFEILSKTLDKRTFHLIMEEIESERIAMTDEEALLLWPKIKAFLDAHQGKKPDIHSLNPLEKRLAEAIIYLKAKKRKGAAQ